VTNKLFTYLKITLKTIL